MHVPGRGGGGDGRGLVDRLAEQLLGGVGAQVRPERRAAVLVQRPRLVDRGDVRDPADRVVQPEPGRQGGLQVVDVLRRRRCPASAPPVPPAAATRCPVPSPNRTPRGIAELPVPPVPCENAVSSSLSLASARSRGSWSDRLVSSPGLERAVDPRRALLGPDLDLADRRADVGGGDGLAEPLRVHPGGGDALPRVGRRLHDAADPPERVRAAAAGQHDRRIQNVRQRDTRRWPGSGTSRSAACPARSGPPGTCGTTRRNRRSRS